MAAARTVLIDLDRQYDLRVLAALPGTLALFAAAELEKQLGQMARERRAICFTLLAPVRNLGAGRGGKDCSIATVLVCLHVAPELAGFGLARLLTMLKSTAALDADPAHEMSAPLSRPGDAQGAGLYREAVYGGGDVYVAITTHTPAEIPPEAAAAVAAATKGEAVDIVTTVAVTPYRPAAAAAIGWRRNPPRPTLH